MFETAVPSSKEAIKQANIIYFYILIFILTIIFKLIVIKKGGINEFISILILFFGAF